ncbi:MAG: glycosyltransferase family 39 protein [Candidatus Aenigmarchaeota archaeon]|nr:glycosyltransferase family 39 protein [Candidatus Aenigmarchaeota archaeon]
MAEIEVSFDLEKLKKFILLGFLGAVFIVEVMMTLSNPIAFGDEGFHVSTARYIGTEVDFSSTTPLFGSTINPERFSRAPFWNLIEGSFYFLMGFSPVIVKVLVPFVSFMTGLAIYVLLRRLYSENVGILGAAIAVAIPSFVTYSVLFYTTVPYVFFFSMAFLCLLTAIKTNQTKFWVLSGLFSGIALFTNIAGLFMAILIVLMGVIQVIRSKNRQDLKAIAKTWGIALLIMLLVVSPWAARNVGLFYVPGCTSLNNIVQGNCDARGQIQTGTDVFEGRNAGGGTEGSILNVGIMNYIQFAYGFYLPVQGLALVGTMLVPFSFLAGMLIIAKRREPADVAILLTVLIFGAVFLQYGGITEGRSEDTARYFLSATPLIALAAGTYWGSIKKEGHKMNGWIILAVMVFVLAIAFFSFEVRLAQLDSVKNFVPSFFQACDWVKQNLPEDARLFSLNTYPTRYNCERASVWETDYKADILLSNNLTLVKEGLDKNGIDYVFVQKFALSNAAYSQAYPVAFLDLMRAHNETFQWVYENGPAYGTQEFAACAQTGGCDPGNVLYRVVR